MNIDILFKNDDVLVINKPSGLMVHSDGKRSEPTLTDWIVEHYPDIQGVGESLVIDGVVIDRPGIVHRLDAETSGVLLIAKTADAFAYFKQQFMERAIKKEYHAFVWGHFKEVSGTVDAAIGRSPSDFRRRLAGRGVRGETRDAVTKWKAVQQFTDTEGQQFSFMHLFPQTGRTHQLRVHMQYLQRSIVADHLYASTKPDALGFSRLALHARVITFTDRLGKEIRVEAPYPEDFAVAVDQLLQSTEKRDRL
jgi:23S rRNA pseudouridine1911/1915/1917 synthase